MDANILNALRTITQEERAILDGNATIDRNLYMQGNQNRINAKKLLDSGKLISIRPNTRFVHFPEHTHDYVEVVYMCAGQTTHIVNGNRIELYQGQLLFLSQSATHEVCTAGESDIAVNFIVLPNFFNGILSAIGEEETPLRRFLVDCLCGQSTGPGYLHFLVSDVLPVQNLVENLLFTLMQDTPKKIKTNEMTMTLLFLQLMGLTDKLKTDNQDQAVAVKVLAYLESNYATGSLTDIAHQLHYDLYWLSREIKRSTGKTYTQLVQEKRLAQAAFLLKNTNRNIGDIANIVGYENIGYFHKIFRTSFGVSPRVYRLQVCK